MSVRRKLFTGAAAAVVVAGVGVLLAQREYKSGIEFPEPPVVTPAPVDKPGAPPSDAVVLFDGKKATLEANFKNGDKWEVDEANGWATVKGGSVESKEKFGDIQLHVEFATPEKVDPKQTGQGRGNSGVYLQDRYEVQVLDSFGLNGENNECGGIYTQHKPSVNMCLPPMAWQTYDIEFTPAAFDAAGKKTKNGRATILHNGVKIHDDIEFPKDCPGGQPEKADPGPFRLQDHGDPVIFRNAWVLPVK